MEHLAKFMTTKRKLSGAPRFYYLGVDFPCKWLMLGRRHGKVKLEAVRLFGWLRVIASILFCLLLMSRRRVVSEAHFSDWYLLRLTVWTNKFKSITSNIGIDGCYSTPRLPVRGRCRHPVIVNSAVRNNLVNENWDRVNWVKYSRAKCLRRLIEIAMADTRRAEQLTEIGPFRRC